MANEIQEFFLGQNEQEIENERRKTRALMGLFPYSMGDTDQTKYILRKDGNQNQYESLGSNAIDKPGKVVISNESEKSQEQNWEQMPKVTDFGNRNIETLFAETLHVLHNYLSLKPSPNLEFQEHVLKDIYFYYIGYPYSISTVFDNNGDFYNFIDQSFSNGQIDVNKFSKEIIRYIDDFQERYKSVPKYKSIDKNYYNYNWRIFFDILGIPNK